MTAVLEHPLVTVRAVPAKALALTALASATALTYGVTSRWPSWAVVVITLVPWVPVFALGTARAYEGQAYLAVFYVLVVTQTGHLLEHVAQFTQIHVLDRTGLAARGVISTLDVEWVHFVWNLLVFVAAWVLVMRFRRNWLLVFVVLFATWHIYEHSMMIIEYLRTGRPGHPGLLAKGGLIGGGLPLKRPDLHFVYNLVETLPLIGALIWQVRRSEVGRSALR